MTTKNKSVTQSSFRGRSSLATAMGFGLAALVAAGCQTHVEAEQLGAQSAELGFTKHKNATVQIRVRTNIKPRRTLAITDQLMFEVADIRLERVLQQIIDTSSNDQAEEENSERSELTPADLFAQWFDSFGNRADATVSDTTGLPYCDDNNSTLNGYPIQCPRSESDFAHPENSPFGPDSQPFNLDSDDINTFVPIGIFNRFDMAPASGSNCGEYRLVFARKAGVDNPMDRVLLIFEAALPNPQPTKGIDGCRPVAETLRTLNNQPNPYIRAQILEYLYFGESSDTTFKFPKLNGVAPVVHFNHYGAGNGGTAPGQIRVNLFHQFPWQLRDFHTGTHSERGLMIKPASVKGNPYLSLVNREQSMAEFGEENGEALYGDFLDSVLAATTADGLGSGSWNSMGYAVLNDYNAGQTDSSGSDINQYVTGADEEFRTLIRDRLIANDLFVSEEDAGDDQPAFNEQHVLSRMTFLSCGGCHGASEGLRDLGQGLELPSNSEGMGGTGFVQISERRNLMEESTETWEGASIGPRFRVSTYLESGNECVADDPQKDFLCNRKLVLQEFLSRPVTVRKSYKLGNKHMSGGHKTNSTTGQGAGAGAIMDSPSPDGAGNAMPQSGGNEPPPCEPTLGGGNTCGHH